MKGAPQGLKVQLLIMYRESPKGGKRQIGSSSNHFCLPNLWELIYYINYSVPGVFDGFPYFTC